MPILSLTYSMIRRKRLKRNIIRMLQDKYNTSAWSTNDWLINVNHFLWLVYRDKKHELNQELMEWIEKVRLKSDYCKNKEQVLIEKMAIEIHQDMIKRDQTKQLNNISIA